MNNSSSDTPKKSLFSLKKSRQILFTVNSWYKKNWENLRSDQLKDLEESLGALDSSLKEGSREESSQHAHEVNELYREYSSSPIFKRSNQGRYILEFILALVIALTVAIIVRQMWFELFEIPTGSMRPTFKEKDRLLVTKTSMGLNIPLKTQHFYFNPENVQNGGVVIWSGDKIDMPETTSKYFGIISHTKRYIKRLIGKPGDTLYFYGGQIYGIDKEGKEIISLREAPWMKPLEHIPFIRFEGRTSMREIGGSTQFTFRQMNQAFARLTFTNQGGSVAEIFNGSDWIVSQETPEKPTERSSFTDFMGINNFAMARLLSKEQLSQTRGIDPKTLPEGELYLQLGHHPNLINPKPRFASTYNGKIEPILSPYESIIPLNQEHIDAIKNSLYTARFVALSGYLKRYTLNESSFIKDQPSFPEIPDGTYEFYYGTPCEVTWGGRTKELPKSHPLRNLSNKDVQLFFNQGIEFHLAYDPYQNDTNNYPSRYGYFRSGDLYLLGAPIIKKDDPSLIAYVERELARTNASSKIRPYTPFIDFGPPLKKDGSLDIEMLRTFGLKIPDKHYLVLGDNHAMSLDSRYFGFLPEENLEGSPVVIFWPFEDRLGFIPQAPYPWITVPRLIIWSIFFTGLFIYLAIRRKQHQYPIFKKLST